jgi:PmbA protein
VSTTSGTTSTTSNTNSTGKSDSDLLELAQRVAGQAQANEDVEAYVVRSRQTQVKAYNGDVESLSSASTAGIAVRVLTEGRLGFAYSGAIDDAAVAETLADARDNARFAGVDEFNTIARPDGTAPPELDIDSGKLAGTPVDRKVELALELERAARAAHPAIRGVETAMYGDAVETSAVATSTGIASSWESAACYVVVYVLAGETDETQTGGWYGVGDSVDDLDVNAVANSAVTRAVRMLGAKQPASRRLTVVLEPEVTAQFLTIIGGTLAGDAVLKGYSPFADRVGQSIGNQAITIVEDPTDPASFGAVRFDDEGMATRRIPLIDRGVLQGFVHSAYTGKRSGHGSTGSAKRSALAAPVEAGCRALRLTPGTKTPDELIASVGSGLLVQSVKGLHSGVNPVSGDFSTGAEGMLITDGQVGEPVREITIASTLQRMLQDAATVGNDVTRLPMSATGVSLVVDDVTMSGR